MRRTEMFEASNPNRDGRSARMRATSPAAVTNDIDLERTPLRKMAEQPLDIAPWIVWSR